MRKCFLFFLLLLASLSIFAQEKPSRKGKKPHISQTNNLHERPRMLIGTISVAPTCEWLMPLSDCIESYSPKMGTRYGITLDINISQKNRSDNFYFMVGAMAKNSHYNIVSTEEYTIQDSSYICNAQQHFSAMHLVIPTGIRFRTTPKNSCVFAGNIGIYNQLYLTGKRYDEFVFDENYILKTKETSNTDFVRISESIFAGVGFEYIFHKHCRLSFYANYVCTLPPFFNKAATNFEGKQKKAFSHSIEFSLGFGF